MPRKDTPLLPWLAAIGAIAGTLALVARPTVAGLSLLQLAIFVLPGLLIVRAAAGRAAGWLPVAAFGPFVGFGGSSLLLMGLWLAGARGAWTLAAAPILLGALVPWARRLSGRWPFPVTARGDSPALAALLVVGCLIVAAPFAHVGQVLPEGRAYRAYFTADYVWRRAVVAELAKGDALPANPFYRQDPLHYYWMPHLSTAVAYHESGGNLDELLLVHSVMVDAAFVAFLYGLARWFVSRTVPSALGVAAVLLASSYEGLYGLAMHWWMDAPLSLVRYLNIDAVSRWYFGSLPIDGLQRVLFYQPHHAVGYGLGMLGLLAVAGRARRRDPAAMAVAGTLLGLSLLTSSFAGLMLTCVAALYELCSVLRWREWDRAVIHAAAAALPLALAAALVTALQYVDAGGSIVMLGPNRMAFHNVLPGTLLSFGPMLIITGLAAWAIWEAEHEDAVVFAALAAVCVSFYFYVDIRDHQDVYVGWRVGHLWFIASAALSAIVFQWMSGLGRTARAVAYVVVGMALVAALPTVLIDIYNTQDIDNRAQGPGFAWTLILSPGEIEGVEWLRMHTRPSDLVQVDPVARGTGAWAYIPAFAERRMAAGLPISMVPLHKYETGSHAMWWMFETSSAGAAHEMAARNGIAYLVVGDPERQAHPSVQARFDGAPEYLDPVFRNDAMVIYRVR